MNQLLTEMDGVGKKSNVFFIGATNRPDILDEALVRPGRLDQLIYIPLPDLDSRTSILKATLRKTPMAPNVNIDFIGTLTEGFSGADLSEMCQRATKAGIRDSIEAEEQRRALMKDQEDEDAMMEMDDPVPTLNRKHFEEALAAARVSVDQFALDKFDQFRKKMDPAYAAKQGGAGVPKINWPADTAAQFAEGGDDSDGDLYN